MKYEWGLDDRQALEVFVGKRRIKQTNLEQTSKSEQESTLIVSQDFYNNDTLYIMKHKREDKNVVINIMTAKTREEGEAWFLVNHEVITKVVEPKLEYIHFLVATVNEHSVPETKLVLTPYTKPLASNPLEGAVPEHLKPTIEI